MGWSFTPSYTQLRVREQSQEKGRAVVSRTTPTAVASVLRWYQGYYQHPQP
ncbi:MAG: hypothetical protein AAGF95_17670 [Chloroflexota bacterium]